MQERREGTKGERDISEEVIRRTGEQEEEAEREKRRGGNGRAGEQ